MKIAALAVLAFAVLGLACARRQTNRAAMAPVLPSVPSSAAIVPPALDRSAELARWIEEAPAAAARWFAGQPADAALDATRASLATHPDVLVTSPAFAAEQAARIADADLRLAAFAEVISTWARIDADAARARLACMECLDDLERTHLHELLADAAALP